MALGCWLGARRCRVVEQGLQGFSCHVPSPRLSGPICLAGHWIMLKLLVQKWGSSDPGLSAAFTLSVAAVRRSVQC